MSFKGFSIFSFGGHFVQQSRKILAILVEGHPRNISVKNIFKLEQCFQRKTYVPPPV